MGKMKLLEIKVLSHSLIHKKLKFETSPSMKNTSNKFSYLDPLKVCKKNEPDIVILTAVKFATIVPNPYSEISEILNWLCLFLCDYPSGEGAYEEELRICILHFKEYPFVRQGQIYFFVLNYDFYQSHSL